MASGKRASMREGPLANLFRKTETEGLGPSSAPRAEEPPQQPAESPAVMNTMSEPRSSVLMRSESSIAAARPWSGLEPEPSPRVICAPSWSFTCASEDCSDCASVLKARNSTPGISASIMRLTALTPPPPTPTTRSSGWPGVDSGTELH